MGGGISLSNRNGPIPNSFINSNNNSNISSLGLQSNISIIDSLSDSNHAAIQNLLEQDRIKDEKTPRCLFIGSNENDCRAIITGLKLNFYSSGSFRKALKKNEFFIREQIQLIYRSTIEALQTLCKYVTRDNLSFDSPLNVESSELIMNLSLHHEIPPPSTIKEHILILSKDSAINKAKLTAHDKSLTEAAQYLLDPHNVNRIFDENFWPSPADFLFARSNNNGITQALLPLDQDITINLIDYRARGLKKKYMHCFENISVLIYVASFDPESSEEEVTIDNPSASALASASGSLGSGMGTASGSSGSSGIGLDDLIHKGKNAQPNRSPSSVRNYSEVSEGGGHSNNNKISSLKESLNHCSNTINSPWFKETPTFIILLPKLLKPSKASNDNDNNNNLDENNSLQSSPSLSPLERNFANLSESISRPVYVSTVTSLSQSQSQSLNFFNEKEIFGTLWKNLINIIRMQMLEKKLLQNRNAPAVPQS